MNRIHIISIIFVLLVGGVGIYWSFKPAATPWIEGGRLTLLVRAVPGISRDEQFGIGFDDMELFRSDGTSEQVTIRTRRVLLTPGNDELTLVLDTEVPTGSYTGFGFTMKSPEIRNPWQEDTAPEPVLLTHDYMKLSVPFVVEKDTTSAIILALETLQALHEKDETQYYLPVVQIETRSGVMVESETDTTYATVSGGKIQNSSTFGMDWDGKTRFNYREKQRIQNTETMTREIPIEETLRLNDSASVNVVHTDTATTSNATSTEQATSTDEVGTSTSEDE